ncbi:helix-turn-helix domain-containing protein [Dactylosporangium aurantiacum]|uniref:Helix-turn-helix domain-containing protein n=1 Tax=Dactylosporangium aurantiacum TaxID=35754 RepID=A0A9Q9I7T8_9ACTN|nr:helix-turn-helix domain-containing protein [Dactylosporangium aurantiacum]
MVTNRENELGTFLRAHRAAVRPDEVGLPGGTGVRRTPGLRREEVASLAGVSVDYYTRLERGRETRPSQSVVDALAGALRLTRDEHRHLRELAGRRPAQRGRPQLSRSVRPGVRHLLEALRPNPAYVVGPINDLLAANPSGLRLLAGIDAWPPARRNIIRYVFLHPVARRLYEDWEQMAPGVVAHLRAMASEFAHTPEFVHLVGELTVKSDEFASLWERYEVDAHTNGLKRFRHPTVGRLTLGYEAMTLNGTDGQRLIAYHATPNTPDHDATVLLDMGDPALDGQPAGGDQRELDPFEPDTDPAFRRPPSGGF